MAVKHGWQVESLSKSALTTFEKCGLQYEFGYLQNFRMPGSFKMIIGLCVGFVAEVAFDWKIDMNKLNGGWVDLPLEWASLAFAAKWDAEIARRVQGIAATRFVPCKDGNNGFTKESHN